MLVRFAVAAFGLTLVAQHLDAQTDAPRAPSGSFPFGVTVSFGLGFRGNRAPHVRILNCMGLRAQESPARAKKVAVEENTRMSNNSRTVITWLPLLAWTEEQVWERIRQSGVRHHYAYDLGMPRLSCCFCIFAPKAALILAGRANPELLEQYVQVEKRIGHTFRKDLALAEIQEAILAGEQAGAMDGKWNM